MSDNYKCFIVKIDTSTSFQYKFIAKWYSASQALHEKGRHFEIQDGGRQDAFLAWHWPSKILFFTNLAMYQVSCFYHKVHDFFTYLPHY